MYGDGETIDAFLYFIHHAESTRDNGAELFIKIDLRPLPFQHIKEGKLENPTFRGFQTH